MHHFFGWQLMIGACRGIAFEICLEVRTLLHGPFIYQNAVRLSLPSARASIWRFDYIGAIDFVLRVIKLPDWCRV